MFSIWHILGWFLRWSWSFTVQSTLLRPSRAGQSICPHFFFSEQGQSSKRLTFASNWQLLFFNQRNGENGRRTHFMIKVLCRTGIHSQRKVLWPNWYSFSEDVKGQKRWKDYKCENCLQKVDCIMQNVPFNGKELWGLEPLGRLSAVV